MARNATVRRMPAKFKRRNTDVCTVSAWNDLGLSHETLSSLARLHFASPTAIQKASIPPILSGHDVIGKAQTGTGKSLAFFLPIYEHYLKSRNVSVHDPKTQGKRIQHPPIALILSPTRELAHQLSSHLDALCSSATTSGGPSIATLTGGLSIHKQQRLLANAGMCEMNLSSQTTRADCKNHYRLHNCNPWSSRRDP